MINKQLVVRRTKALNETKINQIKTFLAAVPKVPSHYCRQSTSRVYVDVDYKSWMNLYVTFEQFFIDNRIPPKEKPTYKCFLNVVHEQNLGIYQPKKDQCDLCYAYKNKNIQEEEYQTHIRSKDRARKEKDLDKKKYKNGEVHMVTVDLQAVQTIPTIIAGHNILS